jgi:hypothetical protein
MFPMEYAPVPVLYARISKKYVFPAVNEAATRNCRLPAVRAP